MTVRACLLLANLGPLLFCSRRVLRVRRPLRAERAPWDPQGPLWNKKGTNQDLSGARWIFLTGSGSFFVALAPQELGRGTYGTVWLMRRRSDRRLLAMKTVELPPLCSRDERDLAERRRPQETNRTCLAVELCRSVPGWPVARILWFGLPHSI